MKNIINEIKQIVLDKLNIHIGDFVTFGKNTNSPAGKYDDRNWYMCKLCEYANLSKQGMTIHLSKYHHISSSTNKEKIIELAISETLKYIKK